MSERLFNPWSFMLDWSQSVMDIWFGPVPVAVRRARLADADAIARLHTANFAHGWSQATIEPMLADQHIDGFVAEGGGQLAGFILLRRAADEAELLSIAVEPARRRGGAGRQLLEAGIAALVRERIATLFLEVEVGNAAALALYRRAGFVEVGRRKGYYRTPEGMRDALTLKLDLSRRIATPPVLDGDRGLL